MTTATILNLNDHELEQVDQLCAEFDPEQFVPQWMRFQAALADYHGFLRKERHELRAELEVAVLLGRALSRLDDDLRLQLFYIVAEETVKAAEIDDIDAKMRFDDSFNSEESSRVTTAVFEAGETAIRRALFIDSDPQLVTS